MSTFICRIQDSNVTWYTEDPDFTPCFQKTVLALTPTAFLLLMGPVRICHLMKRKKDSISWNWLHTSKIVPLFLVGFQIYRTISELVAHNGKNGPAFDFISPLCVAFGFAQALFITLLERSRGVRSSGLMFIFWLLTVVLGALRFRSDIEEADASGHLSPSFFTFYPLLLCGFILNLFVDKKPPSELYKEDKKRCPEDDASFLSRITFWWCTGLILKAMKRPLTQTDMWTLNKRYRSEYISSQFDRSHRNARFDKLSSNTSDVNFTESGIFSTKSCSLKSGRHRHFMCTLFIIYFPTILWAAFTRLCDDFITLLFPQILRLLIRFISSDGHEWHGYFYCSVLLIMSLLRSVFNSQFYHANTIFGMRLQSTVVAAIYKKSLKLPISSKGPSSKGQIINLMSVDSMRLFNVLLNLLFVWSTFLNISVAYYFLWQSLGPSAFHGLLIIVLLIPLNCFITRRETIYQERQMKLKDSRIKMMNEILSGIKVLKLYAWEILFKNKIHSIRKQELKILKKGIFLMALNTCVCSIAPFLMALVTFTAYTMSSRDNVLDAEKLFVAIALFNIIRTRLTKLPLALSQIVQAAVSMRRIQNFLNQREIDAYVLQRKDMAGSAVKIENGSFNWNENDLILSNINLKIQENSLTAVVGAVGSGKSSLLLAILGEMNKVKGSVNVKGTVSFVAQEAWIQNRTFQENILFNSQENESKYERAVKVCALKPDLADLPSGNSTEIGEKGINLSGGQRQRVCLARAVYKDTDIYLLDDPLSAVDAHVGNFLFDNVIGPNGILSGKTCVMVTHGVKFLPQVDKILMLQFGHIVESGTFKDLMQKDGIFAHYVNQYLRMEDDSSETWLKEGNTVPPLNEDLPDSVSNGKIRRKFRREEESKHNSELSLLAAKFRRLASKETKPILPTQEMKMSDFGQRGEAWKLVDTEKIETGQVKPSVFLAYFRAVGLLFGILSIVGHTLSCTAGVGSNIWLSDWADDVEISNETVHDERVLRLGVFAALGLTQGLMVYITTLIFLLGSLKAAQGLHDSLFEGILHSPMSFFDSTPCGRILNRFGTDVNTLDVFLPKNANQFLSRFFNTLSTIVVISYTTPMFLVIVPPLFVFYCLMQRCYVIASYQLKRLSSVTWSPVYSHFEDTLVGVISIRAYKQEVKHLQEMHERIDANQACLFPSYICKRWLAIHLEIIGHCIIFFASLFAVIGRNHLSPGIVGLSITYALDVTITLSQLVRSLSSVETNYVAVERIKEYIDLPSEAPWLIENQKPHPDWPKEGKIEFRNYETCYRNGLERVLKRISCCIAAGQKIGIVGRTGSGKTSMMLSLLRIIEATEGSILVDGIDIATIGLHDLRSRLSVIPQDPVLFSGTLRENLDPFGDHSDDELWSALELAHLKNFISLMQEGLMLRCFEGGKNLSAGQCQLVCLARAFLRKTKILILDEATAAVDLETDSLIQATLREHFKDCTVLTIAHRLDTIMDYTRVIVLDGGKIQEFGSPHLLLSDKSSAFYKLATSAGLT